MRRFSQQIREAKWSFRLDPDNHSAWFPTNITGFIDTAPLYIWTPVRYTGRRGGGRVKNPKYKSSIFKFNLVGTFKGDICQVPGLHIGNRHDGRIAERDTLPKMRRRELLIGDGAYIHTPQILCKNPATHTHTSADRRMNKIYDHHRARIEHLVKRVKAGHLLFKCHWRGAFRENSTKFVQSLVTVVAHMTAYTIRRYGAHYPGYGNWAHW